MKKLLLFCALSICLFAPVFAEFGFTGYYRNDLAGVFKRDGEGLVTDVNKLRLKLDYGLSPDVYLHFEPEYVAMVNSQNAVLPGVADTDKLVWDRTYIKAALPYSDITVGKQRVAWGTAFLWNVTDVFNPFAMSFAVAEEERRGIDAVRVQIPLGIATGIDGVVLTDQAVGNSKKGIKYKVNMAKYDLSVSYVDLGDGGKQAGFDMTGELFDLGIYCEAASVSPATLEAYPRIAIGWNYTLEDGLGINMEYLYNGIGNRDKSAYDWTGLFAGSISQLAVDYLFLGFNKTLDEITQVGLYYINNLDDGSFIIYPMYTRNIYQNVDLSFEAMFSGGSPGTEYYPTDAEDPTGFMGSNMYFVKVRYSF